MLRLPSLAVLLITALLASVAYAHHGWSEYDATKQITLTGTIQDVAFMSPHATIKIDVEGKTWLAVLAPPFRMQSRGIQGSSLKQGITVTVVGFPHRSDQGEMRAERITLDGKTVELR